MTKRFLESVRSRPADHRVLGGFRSGSRGCRDRDVGELVSGGLGGPNPFQIVFNPAFHCGECRDGLSRINCASTADAHDCLNPCGPKPIGHFVDKCWIRLVINC